MDEQQDSLGKLPSTYSPRDTSTQGLNAKLLGTEFERPADREMVGRVLMRFAAVFGNPWGSDERSAKIMRAEWESALEDLPAVVIDQAASAWLRSQGKWPKPADLRIMADGMLRRPIEAAAHRLGIHPRRIDPAESMKGFAYEDSPLRRFPIWEQWLNAQHPTLEHFYFGKAQCIEPHEIYGLNHYEADYIRLKFGRELTKHFGRPVGLGVGPHPCRDIYWTEEQIAPPTDESKKRVAEMVREFSGRNRTPEAKTERRKLNLDGASDAFLDLVGEPKRDARDASE